MSIQDYKPQSAQAAQPAKPASEPAAPEVSWESFSEGNSEELLHVPSTLQAQESLGTPAPEALAPDAPAPESPALEVSASDAPASELSTPVAASAGGEWLCSCGATNSGNFCAFCGTSRKDIEALVASVNAQFAAPEANVDYAGGAHGAGSVGCNPNVSGYAPNSPYASQQQNPYDTGYNPANQGTYDAGNNSNQTQSTNGFAIAAIVTGVLAICMIPTLLFSIIFGIAAIVFGALALKAAKNGAGRKGMARAGLITGIVGIALSIITIAGVLYIVSLVHYDYAQFDQGIEEIFNNGNSGSSSNRDAEEAMRLQAEKRLDELCNMDENAIYGLADDLDNSFYRASGAHLNDAGINKVDFARWLTEDMSYEITDVILREEASYVYVTIEMRDMVEFYNKVIEEGGRGLSSDSLSIIGDVFNKQGNSIGYTKDYMTLAFSQLGNDWRLDEDVWQQEYNTIFGL